MKPVTDPALLDQLNSGLKPVTDERILFELNNGSKPRSVISGDRPFAEQAIRQLGLTARAGVQGLTALPNMIGDALGLNSSMAVRDLLTRIGLPNPESGTERVVQDVAGAMAGQGGILGLGRVMSNAAGPVVSRIGDLLKSQPALQLVSAGSGSGAASATREGGGGTVAQMMAGLSGAILPSVVASGAPMSVRGILRGGEEGRRKVAENIKLFDDAGYGTPSVGQATEGRLPRAIESGLSRTPGGAGRIVQAAEKGAENLGGQVDDLASGLSRGATATKAGAAIEKGVKGFVERFRGEQKFLYDKLDNYIPKDAPVEVKATQRILAELNDEIPGAPNISRFFQNEKIKGIESALKADLDEPTAVMNALARAKQELADAVKSRNAAVQTAGKFSAFENQQLNRADNFVPVPGMPRVTGRYSLHPERAAEAAAAAKDAGNIAKARFEAIQSAERKVEELQQSVALLEGKLPYEAIKKLRSLVGRELEDTSLTSSVPRSKWKQLYGALSDDLAEAATAAGPDAQKAYARANQYTRAGHERIGTFLDRVAGKDTMEKIFTAAVNPSEVKEGASTINAVMRSIDPESRNVVRSAFLKRLGTAVAGRQDAAGEVFSPETFLTNWNKISPEAKMTLFADASGTLRTDLEKIAKVAANLREGSKVFSNPSGTQQALSSQAMGGGAFVALLTGHPSVAAAIGGAALTANAASRLMTNPNFVKWLAKSTQSPVGALTSLQGVAQGMSGEDREAVNEFMEKARQLPQQRQGQQRQ